ncbi:hypothetical protein, partial [Acetobacter malorum]|uniref:hypothetical protein n=1 Tax=Acetobacter malorum TaxID=178901 RepID=UPI0039ECBE26
VARGEPAGEERRAWHGVGSPEQRGATEGVDGASQQADVREPGACLRVTSGGLSGLKEYPV